MKRVLITALVLALGAGMVGAFAEGQSEDPDSMYGRGWRSAERPELEEVALTGEVYFEDLDFPVLKTADGEYALMVPRFYSEDVDIVEGQTITVEGFLGDEDAPLGRFSRGFEGDEPHVMVTKAIVDGEEYDLSGGRGFMMHDDPRDSRRGEPMGRTPRGSERGGKRDGQRGGGW